MLLLLLACGGSPPNPVSAFDRDGDGVFSFVDCDDSNAATYPGAVDSWYDGRDANCDGADDYDQDGDGYRWDMHGGEDCDDTDALVGPEGAEIPYDGRDNDCDPTTSDADLDGDGVNHPTDCDDDDPATFPGAPELLGDGVDNDCGNDGDGGAFGAWPDGMKGPRDVRAGTFEGVPVIAFVAEQVSFTSPAGDVLDQPILFQPGLAILDPLDEEPTLLVFHGDDHTDLEQADVPTSFDLATTDDALWFGLGVTSWRSGIVRAHLRPFVRIGITLARQNGPVRDVDDAASDLGPVDVQVGPDGEASLTATSVSTLTVVHGGMEAGQGLGGTVVTDGTLGAGIAPDGQAWSCDSTYDCSAWLLPTDGPPSDPVPLSDLARVYRERDGYLLVQRTDGVRIEGLDLPLTLFPGEDVHDVDAVLLPRDGDSDWIVAAAVVEAGIVDQVAVAFGPVDAGLLSSVYLKGYDEGVPTSVAVWADADHALVAATTQANFGDPDRLWIASFPWASRVE